MSLPIKILLVDADSTIPNIPLMKISTWHKEQGHEVALLKFNIPYYPTKKKKVCSIPDTHDLIYCSVVFQSSKEWIKGSAIFGGTGHSLKSTLPDEIENAEPDYSLYPENDTSYGFLSRGCIRKCSFCVVPQKEGYIRKVANVSDIVRHDKVKFLDNNILALPEHEEILKELADRKIHCCFNQGLDIRLLTESNSFLLSKLKYLGEYVFAFDDWKYLPLIEIGLSLMNWRKPWQLKFFIYVNPSMSIPDTVGRIKWLHANKCLPYVMRDISCWESPLSDFYVDVASWSNQPNLFKNMSFDEFLVKRHPNNISRVMRMLDLWMKG